MKNTNRAHLITPRVVAGFAAGCIGGACVGFLAGSIMLLQGNFVKVFVKIKSVKITRNEMHVYLWCHTTWRTLTGCVVVAEVVTPHPVRRFVGQSSAGLLRIRSYRPPTLLQQFQYPCKGNHTSVITPGCTCNLSCELFRIQNNYCDLRVCGAFLRFFILNGSVRDLLLRRGDRLFKGTTDN